MRTEARWTLTTALGLLLLGCASSIQPDLADVSSAVNAPLPMDLDAPPTDDGPSAELQSLLAQPIDADTAVRFATFNNPDLRASLRELGITRGAWMQARLVPNPRVEVELRESSDVQQPLQTELAVEYDLTAAILAPLRAAAARADLESHRMRVAVEVIRFGYAVRQSVHALQAAEARLSIALQMVDTWATSLDASRALHAAGNLPDADLAVQEAAYQQARADAASFEFARVQARETLQRLLGLHADEADWSVRALPGPEPVDLADDLETRAEAANLEIAMVRHDADAASKRVKLARTEGWLPDISVDVHGEQDADQWELGGGFSFTVPVFDRKQGARRAAEARFDAALERRRGLGVQVRSEARLLRAKLANGKMRADHFAKIIVPARRRVVEQMLLQYNAMQVSLFDLLQAMRERQTAELEAVRSLQDYWDTKAAFEALLSGARVAISNEATTAAPAADTEGTGGH